MRPLLVYVRTAHDPELPPHDGIWFFQRALLSLIAIAFIATAAIGVALLVGALTSGRAQAEGLRLELAAGVAHHRLAPEGSWWYDGFERETKLTVPSFSAGVLWTPIEWKRYRFGLRAGYVDLGTVTASNSFPIVEDHSAADARVNPTCNRTTLAGCTGKFKGTGWAHGWYLGPAAERDFGRFTLGAEAGLLYYKSAWIATDFKVADEKGVFIPGDWDGMRWDQIEAWHGTSYAGLNARWRALFVTGRVYNDVHAADTNKGKDFIGMTSGPVWSVLAGISWPL
jgi:hypothetical protein